MLLRLYHAAVALRTRLAAIALEPPGNVARDICLFRRRVFSATGEASALAFPEIIFLATAPVKRDSARTKADSAPATHSRKRKARTIARYEELWSGIEGEFRSTSLFLAKGGLYLGMNGPLRMLRERAAALLEETETSFPINGGLGFYVCDASMTTGEALVSMAQELSPPSIGFGDASIIRLRVQWKGQPFSLAAWTTSARFRRKTGIR